MGEKLPGKEYMERPGVYALPVVYDWQRGEYMIGVVKVTPPHRPEGKYHLIGGGLEAHEEERHTEALCREIMEETGRRASVGRHIDRVDEYVNATTMHFKKIGYFYEVVLKEQVQEPVEKDHTLEWLSVYDAKKLLHHSSARFILEFYIKMRGIVDL